MHAPSFGSSYLLTTVAFPFSMPGQVQMAGKAGRCHFTWDLRYESATSINANIKLIHLNDKR
jgi:hypothetical protein